MALQIVFEFGVWIAPQIKIRVLKSPGLESFGASPSFICGAHAAKEWDVDCGQSGGAVAQQQLELEEKWVLARGYLSVCLSLKCQSVQGGFRIKIPPNRLKEFPFYMLLEANHIVK